MVATHNSLPQLLSHFGLADAVSRQCYLMRRQLVISIFIFVICVALFGCCPHREGAALDLDHGKLHTIHSESFGHIQIDNSQQVVNQHDHVTDADATVAIGIGIDAAERATVLAQQMVY